MNAHADVLVIGAGIIGLCTALQIQKRSSLNVVVIEQGNGLGEGSTGASSAVCRHRYSHPEMIKLARDGIQAYRQWDEFTGLQKPLAQFQNDGVLWISDEGGDWAVNEHLRLQKEGIRTSVLDATDITSRFPSFNACNLTPDTETGTAHKCNSDASFLFEDDGGYFDPVNALQDLQNTLTNNNVELHFRSRVTEIIVSGGRVAGVKLNNGAEIETPCVVNASGPWCNDIFDRLGLDIPWSLKPTRIQVLHLQRPAELTGDLPVCCDMVGGIYFRTQNRGQQIVLGSTREADEQEIVDNPNDYNGLIDDDFKNAKLHALHHRLPSLPYRGNISGYCGLYTVNHNDMHPIVGESAISGFYVANGFSGHGFKLAPAIGSLLARKITGESCQFDTDVDIGFLSIDRKPLHLDSKNVLA